MDDQEKLGRQVQLSGIFTPSSPVNRLDLFSGRSHQLDRVRNAIFQRGQHVVIYGERGVGKTSLANVISDWLKVLEKYNYQIVRYNCAASSTFHSIWHGVFRELSFVRNVQAVGFSGSTTAAIAPMSMLLPEMVGSEDVRFFLQQVGASTIVVIDEYDRVTDQATSGLMADTIKSLSDHAVDATLVIVGVADSIDDLIAEHRSIERAIVQIQMPRMSDEELLEIMEKGFGKAAMSIETDAQRHIAALSQGLPHNTHELALFAGNSAIQADRMNVGRADVESAILESVDNARQTIISTYHKAITSPHLNLFKEVLLAAALARTDELGYFAATDLRSPLTSITNKNYGIDRYMRHLNEFCTDSRANILERKGERRRFRFRFKDSIMEPFVIMKGIKDGLIKEEDVIVIEEHNRATR
jgi:Cdc6-like AAA superfamily ATPase